MLDAKDPTDDREGGGQDMARSNGKLTKGTTRQYSLGEEVANSISHGVGALLSIAALVIMIVVAVRHGGGPRLAAAIVFGISLFLEFLFSTLYHALAPEKAKRVFRVMDHAAIYVLIAGSYAPYALVTLHDEGGLVLFAVVWGVAVLGVVAECFLKERQPKWMSALAYLAMGWLVIFRLPQLMALLPTPGFALLVAGGVCYTLGTGFYVAKGVPYLHFVWHLFVLAGAACMTLSVMLFVL